MKLGLVYARARNGVIGKDGVLPWHLPEDLAHFRKVTMGSPVIMGRRTWDSLPDRFRPLPGRVNVVVTRQPGWSAAGAERAGSLAEAVARCEPAVHAWVIGGAEMLREAMPLAQLAEVTEIDADFEGDVHAPPLEGDWIPLARAEQVSAAGLRFAFVTYGRGVVSE
ncbi:dihydrofolate reductase [Ramlibacter tataouinensis]|uniref:dihydrofolate reductase n=1 Tax=Ramlibacter tataouinensis TaxID=94132 RepID=UPI0022F3D9E3|nr:dihydrofolate reductase [Ramlibacter tataouinensis]WBY01096.1 dihydrofolate reductase [Ramlibacter tataouinensis]